MIHVVGARCERCGLSGTTYPEALDHYIERHNGDRIVSLCKNAQLCAERQKTGRA